MNLYMIDITDKKQCCGCASCVQSCPKQCISFDEDEHGFRYPNVNRSICIDCGLCEKVCQYQNFSMVSKPRVVYAANNPSDEVRKESSSGGVFTMLAEKVINQGGVVFGARFDDNWEVVHDYIDSTQDIRLFRGAKYMQSRIGNSYKKTQEFLKDGRFVLFSGTGCQILGLKNFLRHEYNNLITIEVICHGVPSPLVWRQYLRTNNYCHCIIRNANFRDKRNGWRSYGVDLLMHQNGTIVETFEPAIQNTYMQLYLKHLSIRPSCTNCPAKSGKSQSDIILGDFWGISNYSNSLDDNKGTSAIIVNSEFGEKLLSGISIIKEEFMYEQVLKHNPSLAENTILNSMYDEFWRLFLTNGYQDATVLLKKLQPSFLNKLYQRIIYKLSIIIKKM